MGSMVAMNGILSMNAETMAATRRIMTTATVSWPRETSLTDSAIIWIKLVSAAPAIPMNRAPVDNYIIFRADDIPSVWERVTPLSIGLG
jgi:hypothetical protein